MRHFLTVRADLALVCIFIYTIYFAPASHLTFSRSNEQFGSNKKLQRSFASQLKAKMCIHVSSNLILTWNAFFSPLSLSLLCSSCVYDALHFPLLTKIKVYTLFLEGKNYRRGIFISNVLFNFAQKNCIVWDLFIKI